MPAHSRFVSKLLVSLLITSVIVALCYFYVDRPLSLYLESLHLSYMKPLRFFEHFPVWVATLTVYILCITPLLRPQVAATIGACIALRIGLSVALAAFLKTELKSVFGRYWTRTWVCNN